MKALLKDRKILYSLSGLTVFCIALALGLGFLSSERKGLMLLKDQRKEMVMLGDEFSALRQRIDAVEGKKNLANVQGINQAVDEVFSSIGLRDRVKGIRSTGTKETKDGIEEEADVSIEKISMNEMLNMFYRIENAPMILTVRKATIKKSFENPELLNITLILSFLKMK